jgi:hypothetical protein
MGTFKFFEKIPRLNRIWGNFYMNGMEKPHFEFVQTASCITSEGHLKHSHLSNHKKLQAYPIFIKIPNSFFWFSEKEFLYSK